MPGAKTLARAMDKIGEHTTKYAIGRRLALQVDHGYGPGAFMETRQEFLHGAHLVSEGV